MNKPDKVMWYAGLLVCVLVVVMVSAYIAVLLSPPVSEPEDQESIYTNTPKSEWFRVMCKEVIETRTGIYYKDCYAELYENDKLVRTEPVNDIYKGVPE